MNRRLSSAFGAFGALFVLAGTQGCAAPESTDDEEPTDDAEAVAEAELRAGGIEKIVTRISEKDLGVIVERVERLEQRGYAAPVVETYAVARALEASRRTDNESSVAPASSGLRPLGGYLWDHLKLNDLESALCRSKKIKCIKTLYVAHKAKSRSREVFADGENGGRRDAFRHSYWNARMVWAGGAEWAKAFADAHENGYPENQTTAQGRLLSEMDFFNNDVGRTHGAGIRDDRELVDALKAAIERGELKAVRFDAATNTGSLVGTDTCTTDPCGV